MGLGLEYLLILLSCIPSHSNLSPEVKRLSQLYQEISLISGFDISPEHLVARIVHLPDRDLAMAKIRIFSQNKIN